MIKRTETNIVHRGRYYFVIIRQYRKLLGFRVWQDVWRELPERFLSKAEAARLALNVKSYLRGRYKPVSAL